MLDRVSSLENSSKLGRDNEQKVDLKEISEARHPFLVREEI
jgi:hypothetical protein